MDSSPLHLIYGALITLGIVLVSGASASGLGLAWVTTLVFLFLIPKKGTPP